MPLLLQIIGIAALIQGGGSAIASAFGATWNFTMRWAVDYQPFAGAVIGIAGAFIALYGWRLEHRVKNA